MTPDVNQREILASLTIRLAAGVGAMTGNRLVRAFGSASDAIAASYSELATVEGVRPETIAGLRSDENRAEAESVLKLCGERGIRVLVPDLDGYPPYLLNLTDRPLALFARGACVWPERAVALVGTRLPSPTGLKAAREFARFLALRGIGVVSGLARGIDTAAHEGSLEGSGITLAVVGSGLDALYPPENGKLAASIQAASGTILSEYPPDQEPLAFNFPVRNRIISGLSQAVVVVEAPRRSGALGTADWALDQGREVMAVPAGPYTKSAQGSVDLIKKGAACVTTPEEIFEEMGWELKPAVASLKLTETSFGIELQGLLGILRPDVPANADQLAEKMGWEARKILQALAELEQRGVVASLPGQRWCLK
jgi:DNA processing protein